MGLLDMLWEQGGSGGQLHHVFRPLMVRKTESKLFLHESEQSVISSPLCFIRNLATLQRPCFPWAFQNFVQVPFPESGTLCLSLDLVYAWLWNSNPESWLNAWIRRKYLDVCIAPFLPLLVVPMWLAVGHAYFSYHFTSTPKRSLGIHEPRSDFSFPLISWQLTISVY